LIYLRKRKQLNSSETQKKKNTRDNSSTIDVYVLNIIPRETFTRREVTEGK